MGWAWGKNACRRKGLIALRSLLILKNKLELLIRNQMSPLYSLYAYPFYKNHICPQGVNNAFPQAQGAMSTPNFCYLSFELFLTKWVCQNFYLMHLGKEGRGGEANCPMIAFDS